MSASNGNKDVKKPAIEKKSMVGPTLARLTANMAGGENKGMFILGTILRLAALTALVTLPWLTGNAMNVINDGGSIDELMRWVYIGLAAALIYLVLSFLADRTFARLATKALYQLQTDLFKNLQTLSMGFFYKTPVGQLLSRITNDAEVVAQYYEQGIAQIIRAVMFIIMIVIVMLIINVPLTIVALLIVPVMVASMLIITRIASPAFDKLQEELGDASGFQEETLAGHKVIISKRRQEWAGDVNEGNAAGVFQVGSKAFFTSLLQFPLTQSLTYIQVVLVYVVGSLMVIDEQITLGTVTAFAGYVALMASPLSQISNLVSSALNAAAGGERVYHIIDEQPTVVDAPDAKDYEFKGGHIEFKNVDFDYVPGRLILRNNNIEVQPGESIGICGPTGAGKSTIINILTRYYELDSGQILIDGQDLAKLPRTSLRRQIGAVLQEAFLFTDTVMNNLKYANAGATEEDVIAAAKKANAHDFIMNLPQGYDTLLTERGAGRHGEHRHGLCQHVKKARMARYPIRGIIS